MPTDFISPKDEGGGTMRQYLTSIVRKKRIEIADMEEENEGLQNQLRRSAKTMNELMAELKATKDKFKGGDDMEGSETVVSLIEALEKKMESGQPALSQTEMEIRTRKERSLTKQIKELNIQIATMQSQMMNFSNGRGTSGGVTDSGNKELELKLETITKAYEDVKENLDAKEKENEILKDSLTVKEQEFSEQLEEMKLTHDATIEQSKADSACIKDLQSELELIKPKLESVTQENEANIQNLEKIVVNLNSIQTDEEKEAYGDVESMDKKVDLFVVTLQALPSRDEMEQERKKTSDLTEENEKLKTSIKELEMLKEYESECKDLRKEVSVIAAESQELNIQFDSMTKENESHKKAMEAWRESAVQSDKKYEELKEKLSATIAEKNQIQKSLEEMEDTFKELKNTESRFILEDKLNTVMNEYESTKETVAKQAKVIDRLKQAMNEQRMRQRESPRKPISDERFEHDVISDITDKEEVKPVENLLDFSKAQIEEIMKVNKSYEDGAIKSSERYKLLRDLYDDTMKKLKAANELTTSLQSDLDESRKKVDLWENMYRDMKTKFEKEQKELIAEADNEHKLHEKEQEQARDIILELEESLEVEENEKSKLLDEFKNIEMSVAEMAEEHEQQDKEYAGAISDLTSENQKLQRDLDNLDQEKSKLESKTNSLKRDLVQLQQKVVSGEKERSNMLKTKLKMESNINELEQLLNKEKNSYRKLQSQAEQLEDSISMKNREYENDKEKQARLIKKLSDLNGNMEKELAEEKAKSGFHIGQIENERRELQEELENVLDELDEKENVIKDMEDRVEQERETISKLKSEISHLKAAVVRDEKWRNDETNDIKNELKEIKLENDELNDQISSMKTQYEEEIEKLEKSLRKEENLRETLAGDIQTIEHAVMDEASRHEKEIEGYKEIIDSLEQQKEELQNMIVLLERELERKNHY